MDHETAAQVAQTRARMAEIRARLDRLQMAEPLAAFEDLEGDLSKLIVDARWLYERVESQRAAMLAYARELVQTHEGIQVASRVVATQLREVIGGIEGGAGLDQAVKP